MIVLFSGGDGEILLLEREERIVSEGPRHIERMLIFGWIVYAGVA